MSGERTRLRLVVVQALVFSLFATLLARLWFLQVAVGEEYQAQAASQSVREIVVQPERGLIVDAMGRPLVSNRSAWQVSIDRSVLERLEEDQQDALLQRVAETVGVKPRRVRASLVNCGDDGAVSGTCWNGSPFQAVPIAEDVDRRVALRIQEQAEDFPAVVVEEQSVRTYPGPFDSNAAHALGYLSPITESELDLAREEEDRSVNGASVVGRAGLEKQYDRWLRGMPGYERVAVDSMGRVVGDDSVIESEPGHTLVTSLDAKVQSLAERELARTIREARATRDEVTGRNFVADAGAVVVLEAQTGRLVAMASQPDYDPEAWVGGIGEKQLQRLYSEEAGTPLLSRATQGQFAPGSTWKPFMTAGALTAGYSTDARLNCSSGLTVGNNTWKNYESGAYGSIGFPKALEVSCNTFFYRIGYDYWQRFGSDVDDVEARDPLIAEAKEFGFGRRTGVDLPSEAAGRIADRRWKAAYHESMEEYYCGIADKPRDHPDNADVSDFVHKFAREFCLEGFGYRASDAINFAIGQGDTIVTPLQLARGYAAFVNGGKLLQPRLGKAVVDSAGEVVRRIEPEVERRVDVPRRLLTYIDEALKGVTRTGTMSWRMGGFPLDEVTVRAKTGSAEVHGKQSSSWLATYTEDYVVVMMVSQGGTGSGTSGPAVRRIWEGLYGIRGEQVRPARAAIDGVTQPAGLPTFSEDGSILPPGRKGN